MLLNTGVAVAHVLDCLSCACVWFVQLRDASVGVFEVSLLCCFCIFVCKQLGPQLCGAIVAHFIVTRQGYRKLLGVWFVQDGGRDFSTGTIAYLFAVAW